MDLLYVLINSDIVGSEAEAYDLIDELREAVDNGENPEELLHDLGLEPDYVFDLFY